MIATRTPAAPVERASVAARLSGFREGPALLILGAILLWLLRTNPNFRKPDNLAIVGQEAALIGIMACGEALVILTGGIDLSVGATLALSACIAGGRMAAGWSWPAAALCGLAAGAAAGLLNGALITYRKLTPILTTLATLLVYRAITNIETGGVPFNRLPAGFSAIGRGFLPFWVFLAISALVALVVARVRFGRRVVAVGGSEQSARLSGIPVDAVLRRVYLLSGLLAAVSGLLMAASVNNAQWNLGDGWELDVIAAVVIGGVRLTGGEGSVIGAALGAMIIVVMRNALFLNNVPVERYGLITGGVIVLAALVEQLRRTRQEPGR